MTRPKRLLTGVTAASAILAVAAVAHGQRTAGMKGLPVTAVAPRGSGSRLVLILTGEGGTGAFETALSRQLARAGEGVLVLDSRLYLRERRSPSEVASDVGALVTRYVNVWHRGRLVLLGYSRGADVAPFVANRLAAPVKAELDGMVLLSPTGGAAFELTLRDLVNPRPRATDLPVMPEVERLRGSRMLCSFGSAERSPFCTRLDSTLARVVARNGGHDLDASDGAAIAGLIENWLGPEP